MIHKMALYLAFKVAGIYCTHARVQPSQSGSITFYLQTTKQRGNRITFVYDYFTPQTIHGNKFMGPNRDFTLGGEVNSLPTCSAFCFLFL